ncbi:MAG: tol-pal system protein YbgF [Gemmatimonadaceae bacterium]
MRFAWIPAAALAAGVGGCATREDVRVLQSELLQMRAATARSDSMLSAQVSRVLAELRGTNDTLETLNARLTKLQGDVRGELYSLGQQLITVQELTGQSQRRLQELRSSLEQRAGETTAQQAAAAGDTAAAARAAAPGPNQLFQLSLDQLRRGSAAAARTGFEELLRQYPRSDVAPDAQFYVGEAHSAEGNAAAADSAYAAVTALYPNSPRAPTALYKRALGMEARGDAAGARAALSSLVERYPRSDEATLARDRLRAMR